MEVSKELLSEVLVGLELDYEYPIEFYSNKNAFRYWVMESPKYQSTSEYINIYELLHLNFKHWAKLMDVFDKIDWSEEPKEIIKKVEELRKEINEKQLQH